MVSVYTLWGVNSVTQTIGAAMRERLNLKAVWDSDLEELLRNIGALEPLVHGELACKVCGQSVDLDNLGAILPRNQGISVTCGTVECVRAVTASGQQEAVG